MTKILDLRKKVHPQVKIIYKTVIERQSWYVEIGKVLAVVAIVSFIVWGTSKADNVDTKPKVKNFSVSGIVSDISSTTLSLINTHGTDGASDISRTFDLGGVKRIEDKNHAILALSDIVLNDEVVAQGTITDGFIDIRRIISFGLSDATSTATSTIATTTATTTIDLASSTPEISSSTATSTTATTTDDAFSTTTLDLSTSTATTTDVTSTDNTSSTTPDITATTTDDVAPSNTPDATTSPDIIPDTSSSTDSTTPTN